MERTAIFVDASWFVAEAALALTGRGDRRSVECDVARTTATLAGLAVERTGLPLLRIYWYDPAPEATAGADVFEVASLANVKLRPGRAANRARRDVDGLLVLDLTTLARERAIASALVFSGDEDVREGIAAVQSMGVRVTVGAIEIPDGRPNQSTALVHEADERLLLDAEFVAAHFQQREVEWLPVAVGAGAASTPREWGHAFGAQYADACGHEELRQLQRDAPELPALVAAQLFRDAEQVFGPLRGRQDVRRELRHGFWDHVMQRR
jgi:uncharacterized LabA/DUF88 family protein